MIFLIICMYSTLYFKGERNFKTKFWVPITLCLSLTRTDPSFYTLSHLILTRLNVAYHVAHVMNKRTDSERLKFYKYLKMFLSQSSSKLSGMYLFFAFLLKSYAGILSLTVQNRTWGEEAISRMSVLNIEKNYWKRLLKWTLIYLEHKKWWTDRLPIIWCKYTAESLFNFNVSCTLSPLITGLVMSLI